MKKLCILYSLIGLLWTPLGVHAADYRAFYSSVFDSNEVRFILLGASGVILNAPKGTIIIDPAMMLADADIAQLKTGGLDLILFTHNHGDHYNSETAVKLFKATDAPILAEALVAESLSGKIPAESIAAGLPGKTYVFGDIEIMVVEGDHLGPINLYRVKIGEITIFHGGDSAYVPLKNYPSSVTFLPTGAPSPTCSPEYAFKMAFDLKPKVAVPMHGNNYEHLEFEKKMTETMPGTIVLIPTKQVTTRARIVK